MTDSGGISWGGQRIEGIVFDVDGTLTDSIDAYYEVFRRTCAKFGIQVNRQDVLEPMAVGSNIWDRAIPQDIPDRAATIELCLKEIPRIFQEVIAQARPFPELDDLLSRLQTYKVRLGILTSSWKYALVPLKNKGLLDYFDAVLSREDGYPAKPKPGGILACLEKIGVDPANALSVGDSPMDIRAGKSAGTLTVGVLSGISGRRLMAAEEPTTIIDQVGELRRVLSL